MTPDDERLYVVDKDVRVWDLKAKKWTEENYSRFVDLRFTGDGDSFIALDTWDDAYYLYKTEGERKILPNSGTYFSLMLPISQFLKMEDLLPVIGKTAENCF